MRIKPESSRKLKTEKRVTWTSEDENRLVELKKRVIGKQWIGKTIKSFRFNKSEYYDLKSKKMKSNPTELVITLSDDSEIVVVACKYDGLPYIHIGN